MKTKQSKEEQDKSLDEDTVIEPKTRARKKASDTIEDDKKLSQDEPKTSKDIKKPVAKPRAVVKRRPLGIRKTLRSKQAKAIANKEQVKQVIKQTAKRGRKAALKHISTANVQDKEIITLIPASEIKKEPIEDTTSNSRSSSPKTAGRRQRLSSDLAMMKTMLGDSPSTLVLGSRTSPYSMRSERSNSPSLFDGKNLRSGKPRKVKNNLLNEVVMKEQKKRRRLNSDSKTSDIVETPDDCKKVKRGRSCSRDGSEISKCSDNTESDMSMSETLNDTDTTKELNKKLDKSKTDLDVDIENNVQISTIEKVPSHIDSKLAETKLDAEPSSNLNAKDKKKLSLKRSTSLDSDNNNSNRIKLENLNSTGIEGKTLSKTDLTDPEMLFEARSSILTSMSKTFNSKEMSKNIRKARRGRKVGLTPRSSNLASRPVATKTALVPTTAHPTQTPDATVTAEEVVTADTVDNTDGATETIESLTKEINDLINDLDQNIDGDQEMETKTNSTTGENIPDQLQTKTVSKFYGLAKPFNGDNVLSPDTPVKDKDVISPFSTETTPSKDDGENIRLHYEEDSVDKPMEGAKHEITYKCSPVASIDKLMDRLKEFEELDKRRQLESKVNDGKTVMVTSDVVLIPKSGDIKPLKDIQSVRSPEKPIEKEDVLSCFENNSAISIVKRDQVRKSTEVDLPNSVTLIKRNSFSSRKESTSSNHSGDAISIFEKSLGKDVTLTEIRKTVDKSAPQSVRETQAPIHQFATLHPNTSQSLVSNLDSNQISITPRILESKITHDVQIITKRKSRESMSRKSSETSNDTDDKMATIEKITSAHNVSSSISITPTAVKSAELTPVAIKTSEVTPITITSAEVIPVTIKSVEVTSTPVIPTEITHTEIKSAELTAIKPAEISGLQPTELTAIKPVELTATKSAELPAIKSTEATPVSAVTPEVKSVALKSPEVAPVAIKSPEVTPVETEALPPPIENIKEIEDTGASEVYQVEKATITESLKEDKEIIKASTVDTEKTKIIDPVESKMEEMQVDSNEEDKTVNKIEITDKVIEKSVDAPIEAKDTKVTKDKPIAVEPKIIEETKPAKSNKPKSARNSIESQPGPSNVLNETPESQKHKENVLRTLGLLTHKAAKEAKIEKLREKERIYGSTYFMGNKNKTKTGSGDYTGTLKTVIKLNRGVDKKKHRSSLKITFQKSKYRTGKPAPEVGEAANEDDAYYTIERREAATGTASDGGHRKSHYSNRLNNHETEAAPEPVEPKETLNLVIPEKASSFSIHPGRLCMDQCFYCGGKFGLFDTPCHIAQIKSSERQKKVLDNEEKLTIDSCLCDACYRHVDRRANCPSYRKRPIGKPPLSAGEQPMQTSPPHNNQSEKPPSPPLEEDSEEEPQTAATTNRVSICHTEGCAVVADHSIRRKWLIKLRSSVNKLLKLKGDYPGLHTIPLCAEHYRCLTPLMACVLCRRRLTKHHNVYFIHHGYQELNPLLLAASIPVQFSERPVLCKTCRYYCTLLQRPGDNQTFAHAHRLKLLQTYNIELPPTSEYETEDQPMEDGKVKKKRSKSKQSSLEPENSESSERNSESTPEKDKQKDQENDREPPLEEDIESLISSNKILVPNASKSSESTTHSDGSDAETTMENETTIIPIDKQTELQYLLQKQNNPAQFLPKANLTGKQRNILKIQNISGIQKHGHQHRINDLNAKRIHKLGHIVTHKEKPQKEENTEEEMREGLAMFKNIPLNEECTIESIPNKRPADINTLKNKWQMSESFTQVKKNLSELSKSNKDPKKGTEVKYSNPVKRLETNPSISVRELLPGEEEMNLQCNIEFNNVKGVTPHGWEKCNTMIQYDVETKKLWSELQRPYGNQSSFLRHLILLEKYFRSGDLVLSHNANPHAANYSDSAQSRLRAYDNVVPEPPKRSEQPVSLIEFRKKPSINGKSLLKTNQNDSDKETKKFMPPPGALPKTKSKSEKSKSKPLPPELIAINTPNAQGRKAIQNVLHNIQQLVKGVSASDPTEIAAAPLPATVVTTKLDTPPPTPKEKKEATKKDETPKKVKTTSKPWRPTLMPITPENLAKIAREPTQVAVDGRTLPSLVQVMSAGQRFHITLQDYNKMCIMRREKLQQLQDGEKSKRQPTDENTVVTEIQPSTMLGNGGTVVQNITTEEKKDVQELAQIGANAATILKNVGLKNITIAPITPKTATITSQTVASPVVTSPSLLVTSTPIKLPQLGPAVSIVSETIISPPVMTSHMIMPKIPKSLTVIPQTVMTTSQVNSPSVTSPAVDNLRP